MNYPNRYVASTTTATSTVSTAVEASTIIPAHANYSVTSEIQQFQNQVSKIETTFSLSFSFTLSIYKEEK